MVTFSRGACSFYIENKLKSEISNDKKVNKKKVFVITKNLNWVILTKKLVTFERWDRVKDIILYRRDCLKRRGFGQFAYLRGGLAKRDGWCF